jgi:aspartate/glutamate racemase
MRERIIGILGGMGPEGDLSVPVIDPISILAKVAIEKAKGKSRFA